MEASFIQSTSAKNQTQSKERRRALALLEGTIFYGLIAVIVFSAIPYGTVDPWSQAVVECAVFVLGLGWVIHGLVEGSWRVGNLRLVFPMIVLVVFAILQSFAWSQTEQAGTKVLWSLSADAFESRTFALRVAALLLACVLFIRFTISQQRLNFMVHAIITLAIACALFGIARQALQHGEGFLLARLKQGSGYGQFINKDHFSYLMEMAFGLTVGVAFMRSGRPERIPLYLSGLVVIWAALVLSLSRGGLLAMSIQMIFAGLLFLNSRNPGRRVDGYKLPDPVAIARGSDSRVRVAGNESHALKWLRSTIAKAIMIVALLITIVAGVAWLGGDQLATGVETASIEMAGADTSELHEAARRRDIWRASWRMFVQHPIAGAGLGGFWAEMPSFHEGSGVLTPQQAHNDYLEVLASAGLIGAALLVWFAIVLVKQTRRSIRASEGFQRAVSLGAIVGVAGVAVHSVVDFGLHVTVNALVLMALLAILSLKPFKELRIAN